MNTHSLSQTGHPLNLKNYRRVASLFIVTLLALSMVSVFSPTCAQDSASSVTPALHTSGTYIVDSEGNVVYLRGMGLAGFVPNLILWGNTASDSWSNQWNTNPTPTMEQTFANMRDQWHINYIRVFIYPSWYYRNNIAPSQEDPASYGAQTTPINTKTYLHTLIQTAAKYGIYVNIVPYMLTPSASSFGGDPYASQGYGWQGLPMEGWDEPARRFLSDAGYGGNELGFWRWFWSDMANTYKGYDNVIFEAWNEPNLGIDNDAIPTGYMQYLQTMYSAIRSTGASNLIMMQWHMGWHPNAWGNDLSWIKQIAAAIPNAVNIVYTTHLYYYAPTDLTQYWRTDYDNLKSQLQDAVKTMGVVAPLVINEEGSCLARSSNSQRDVTWWSTLLRVQYDLGIGAGAYYWLSDTGLGPIYAGETMLTRNYAANAMGKAYIDSYKAPTKTIQTTQPTLHPTDNPTLSQTTNPALTTPSPTPVLTDPQPTQPATTHSTQTTSSVQITLNHITQTPTPYPTQTTPQHIGQTTTPYPPKSIAISIAPLENPAQSIVEGYFYWHWIVFFWA
ncbi:MAG: glycoside hydrolase family 5 protein [Nitrososphaerota archaeon]|jgi:hypothetical protein|nr:glycoside hydrolase family 5 protein [Nitrososphaerota archaeon]